MILLIVHWQGKTALPDDMSWKGKSFHGLIIAKPTVRLDDWTTMRKFDVVLSGCDAAGLIDNDGEVVIDLSCNICIK